jgi:hypothetical protein
MVERENKAEDKKGIEKRSMGQKGQVKIMIVVGISIEAVVEIEVETESAKVEIEAENVKGSIIFNIFICPLFWAIFNLNLVGVIMIMMGRGDINIGLDLDQEENHETDQGHALALVNEKGMLIVLCDTFSYC